jgi:hypothetical protein
MKTSLEMKLDWLMTRKEEEVCTPQGSIILEREINRVSKELEAYVSLGGETYSLKQAVSMAAKIEFLKGMARRANAQGNKVLAYSLFNEAASLADALK